MAKMNRAYVYRLYPNAQQENQIQRTFGCCRFVYNRLLEDRITAYKERGESRTFSQQSAMLPPLKKEYPWLKEVDSTALIAAAKNLDGAYQKFFSNVKKGEKPGFPRFKSKKNARKSYQTKNPNGKTIRFHGNKIKFLKLGLVKIAADREIPSDHRILSATITQEGSGKYYVSVLTRRFRKLRRICPRRLDWITVLLIFTWTATATARICPIITGTRKRVWRGNSASSQKCKKAVTTTGNSANGWLVAAKKRAISVRTGNRKRVRAWRICMTLSVWKTLTIKIWLADCILQKPHMTTLSDNSALSFPIRWRNAARDLSR